MNIPELISQVKEQVEQIELAERAGWEVGVITKLAKLRELLNDQFKLEAKEIVEAPPAEETR